MLGQSVIFGHNILTEGVFVNQLSSNARLSVWQIVWVTTNCRCMSDIEFLLILLWWFEKNVCRTEASDGFIVRPKEDGTLVEWWQWNVEEIWMKMSHYTWNVWGLNPVLLGEKPLTYLLLRNKMKRFYILLTVHHVMILGKWPTWWTNSFLCIYFHL